MISDDGTRGEAYDRRFAALAGAGHNVHGEAEFVEALGVRSVLDAGCGSGRVAIELARRGLSVTGVDLDPSMLAVARLKAPEIEWHLADLQSVVVGREFGAVVMAGNVMIFVEPGTEGAVVANLAGHLEPAGLLIAGFQLHRGGYSTAAYDDHAEAAGLALVDRWATWDRRPWRAGGGYAVSVHRRTR